MVPRPLTCAALALSGGMSAVSAATCASDCTALSKAGIAGSVLVLGTDDYETRAASWWSATDRLEPSCIVQPKDTADVSKVLQVLQKTQGKFAIRSGGHSQWAGGSNVDGGVTIDLVNFKGASYNATTKLASILPSTRWGDVFASLEADNIVVPGGRDGDVGVAGFLTGGGNSYYAAHFGLACDAVVNAEVVLANGTIVNANQNENADLHKALKGGWGNFGIVTRFDMETKAAGPIWGGIRASNVSEGAAIAEAMVNFTASAEQNKDDAFLINWTYNPSLATEVVVAQVLMDVAGVEKPSVFDSVLALPELFDDFSTRNMSTIAEAYLLPGSLQNVWFSYTFANDVRIINKAAELNAAYVADLLAEIPATELGTQMLFQPLPAFFANESLARGGNVLGLDAIEGGDSLLWLLASTVNSTAHETILHDKSAAYAAELSAYAESIGGLRDWRYINYVDSTQDPITSYGAANVEFLREVSAKYDPTGFFQKRQAGGFKLPTN